MTIYSCKQFGIGKDFIGEKHNIDNHVISSTGNKYEQCDRLLLQTRTIIQIVRYTLFIIHNCWTRMSEK